MELPTREFWNSRPRFRMHHVAGSYRGYIESIDAHEDDAGIIKFRIYIVVPDGGYDLIIVIFDGPARQSVDWYRTTRILYQAMVPEAVRFAQRTPEMKDICDSIMDQNIDRNWIFRMEINTIGKNRYWRLCEVSPA